MSCARTLPSTVLGVSLLLSVAAAAGQTSDERSARNALVGSWTLNRELSAPTPSPDVGGGRRGGGGFGGGGFGGVGLGGPGTGRGGGSSADARAEAERLNALTQELLTPSPRLRISRDAGETLAITTGSGRTTRYVPNGKREKHQLTNGVIETRTAWARAELQQDIEVADSISLTRSLSIDSTTGQLLVTITFLDGQSSDRPFRVVYERDEP